MIKSPSVGVLGGGQLGKMLLQAGLGFDASFGVLDPDESAPCAHIANPFVVGSFNDYNAVLNFGRKFDVLTIEIENVNVQALKTLESEGIRVFPQPNIIEMIQDKGRQKNWLLDNNFPTAPFTLLHSESEIKSYNGPMPVVQKLCREGYDGRGVKILTNKSDLQNAFTQPSLFEKKIDIDNELSVIVARNQMGEISVFPPVELVFNKQYNLLDYLIAPASLDQDILEKAKWIASSIASAMGLVGVLAIEFFVTKGELLVNEMAPRPHNSGHHTIRANHTSQYEQLIRALLNLPLGSTQSLCHSAVVNLVGSDGHNGLAIYSGLDKALAIDGVSCFLYGKKFTKPGRKMGHLTITADNIVDLRKTVEQVNGLVKVISEQIE